MQPDFQIFALPYAHFAHFFDLSEFQLSQLSARRMIADKKPGYPCRVSLQDAEIGEEMLLLPFAHHPVDSPYQASGPIYVRKNAPAVSWPVNQIPPMLPHRLLSVRAYSAEGMMLESNVTEGRTITETLRKCFQNPSVDYVHIHNAKAGCYNCLVRRASPASI
jgi:hypothetical protein